MGTGRACPRCGTFAKLRPWIGRQWCRECFERVRPPGIGRAPAGALLDETWNTTWRIQLRSMAVLVPLCVPLAASNWLPEWFPTMWARLLWGIPLTLAWVMVLDLAFQARLSPEPLSMGHAWRRLKEVGGWLIVTRIMRRIEIFFFTLACFVPGVMRAMTLFIAEAAIVADGGKPADALALSKERMMGHRTAVFGPAFLVWLLPWLAVFVPAFVGGMAAGLGADPEATRPLLAAGDLAWPVLVAPLGALQAATYVRLGPVPSWEEEASEPEVTEMEPGPGPAEEPAGAEEPPPAEEPAG